MCFVIILYSLVKIYLFICCVICIKIFILIRLLVAEIETDWNNVVILGEALYSLGENSL